jgi:hypothetical protein
MRWTGAKKREGENPSSGGAGNGPREPTTNEKRAPRRTPFFCRLLKRRKLALRCLFRLRCELGELLERCCVIERHVSENLTVQVDAGDLQLTHEA